MQVLVIKNFVYKSKVFEDRGLQLTEEMKDKCMQVYETLQNRPGIIIVGPSCSAKSTLIHVRFLFFKILNTILTLFLEIYFQNFKKFSLINLI